MFRLMLEAFADMVLFSFICIEELEWNGEIPYIALSLRLSWVSIILHCLIIAALPISLWRYRNIWLDEESRMYLETLLMGTDHSDESKLWHAITFVFIFMSRRLAIGFALAHWSYTFWPQIAVHYFFAIANLIFLQWSKPLET